MSTLTLPFSNSTLQAALRRYLDQPSLEVGEVVPRKLGGGFSGSPVYRLKISYYSENGEPAEINLVFKEGAQSGGAISYSVAGRESRFYNTLAADLPVRTPQVLLNTYDDLLTEEHGHDTLVVGDGGSNSGLSLCNDWVLIEALPKEGVWPQTQWNGQNYTDAVVALAQLHAQRWAETPNHSWLWEPTGAHAHALAVQARQALLEIEGARWGGEFFAPEEMRAWLALLDNPDPLLTILNSLPRTLIHGDYWPGNIALKSACGEEGSAGMTVFDWQFVGVGPAVYDLSCLHSTSRWWFGRLPYSLTEMRGLYLRELNTLLGYRANSALSSEGLDAARAWRFATFWPSVILQYHTVLLARRAYLRSTVLEPALASLGRCMA